LNTKQEQLCSQKGENGHERERERVDEKGRDGPPIDLRTWTRLRMRVGGLGLVSRCSLVPSV